MLFFFSSQRIKISKTTPPFQLLQKECSSSTVDKSWGVVCQMSSIGSLGSTPETWLTGEFVDSLSGCDGGPSRPDYLKLVSWILSTFGCGDSHLKLWILLRSLSTGLVYGVWGVGGGEGEVWKWLKCFCFDFDFVSIFMSMSFIQMFVRKTNPRCPHFQRWQFKPRLCS